MKRFPTLYKIDSKGKIREWSIIVEGNTYTQIYGIKDGKMQHVSTEIKVGKNIGRANETTAEEQCRAEAESLWKKQRDRKGYTEDIPTEKPMRPMLAKSFDKDGKCIEFPCYVQKKYDGCVSGDTLIKTKEYGYKPISWIVDNQIECKVKSRNKNGNLEYKPITYHFKNKEMDEECQWYELELETGEKLTVTGNHPVYLPDLDCWRRVDELDGTENLMVF